MRSGSKASGIEVTHCNSASRTSCQQSNVSVSDNLGQIILSAGTLGTPKILYFSGIGPNDMLLRLHSAGQLQESRDGWVINENVGRGLYDNPNTFIMLQSPQVQSYAFGYNGSGQGVVPADLTTYRNQRSGPYASPGQTGVFWDTVQRSDGRKVAVCNVFQLLLIVSDARYCYVVRLCRLHLSKLFHTQYLWHIRSSVPRSRRTRQQLDTHT